MEAYDFANILLSGRCNLNCPCCIGHSLKQQSMPDNLNLFPLKGLDDFIDAIRHHGVTQVSLTGTNTEPQLYRFEVELLGYLREKISGVQVSLHTNGTLVLQKIGLFNLYDRATLSLPSFDPETYRTMTGSARVPDLEEIMRQSKIPLKISTLITEHNSAQVPFITSRCRSLGIRRMVLRKLYGETRPWDPFPHLQPVRYFGKNPVYDIDGMEITVWDFSRSELRCLNLFSDGSISREYELTRRNDEKP